MSAAEMIYGAEIIALDAPAAQQCVDWVLRRTNSPPAIAAEACWAVLQCDLSLTWALRDGDRWVLACEVDSAIEAPDPGTLRELRLFGPAADVLIWRSADALKGRVLRDAREEALESCEPVDHFAGFETGGDPAASVPSGKGFVTHVMPNGRTVVAPAGKGVAVRQYLSEDQGVLRVAATRFVEVR